MANARIYTLKATPVKHGPGSCADAGWELKRLGVSRAMLVTDAGVRDRYLRRAVGDPDDVEARGAMMLAASLAGIGYAEGDVDALVDGALKQQRLLVLAPRETTRDDLARIVRDSLDLW